MALRIKDCLDQNLDDDIVNFDAILIEALRFREMNSRSDPRNANNW